MELADALAFLTDPARQATKPGLDRVRALLAALGNPERRVRFVHVAGTNGKGSISAYLSAICRAAGLTTGLFASPAFEVLQDTITINGQRIGDAELAAGAARVRDAARAVEAEVGAPSAFELQCALALLYFAEVGCDLCIMEAGMGGRLDATNVIAPEVCIIARIGFDHTDHLGSTLGEIAAEKAGIIKRGAQVVSWPQSREARAVIEDACEALGCPLAVADFSRLTRWLPDVAAGARKFSYKDRAYATRMLGSYQPENASVALEGALALRCCGWDIGERAIRAGIAEACVPARFEVLRRAPLVVLDGAHNPQGARALAESLRELAQATGAPQLRAHLVMGVLADKDFEAMIGALLPLAASFTVYAPPVPRALPAADLARAVRRQAGPALPVYQVPDIEAAVAQAMDLAGSDGCVVAFGSLSAAARARRAILSA